MIDLKTVYRICYFLYFFKNNLLFSFAILIALSFRENVKNYGFESRGHVIALKAKLREQDTTLKQH